MITLKLLQSVFAIIIYGILACFFFWLMYLIWPEVTIGIGVIALAGISYELYKKYGKPAPP